MQSLPSAAADKMRLSGRAGVFHNMDIRTQIYNNDMPIKISFTGYKSCLWIYKITAENKASISPQSSVKLNRSFPLNFFVSFHITTTNFITFQSSGK